MLCLRAALNSSTAPFITPWSVRPTAGWPNAAARSTRASILHAPSSSEYSEWTCRWAQGDGVNRAFGTEGEGTEKVCSPSICTRSDRCRLPPFLAALCANEPLPEQRERPLLPLHSGRREGSTQHGEELIGGADEDGRH